MTNRIATHSLPLFACILFFGAQVHVGGLGVSHDGQFGRGAAATFRDDRNDEPYHVLTVAFAPDSQSLACGGNDSNVRIWNVPDRRLMATLAIGNSIHSVAFDGNGRNLAVASGHWSKNGVVQSWDTAKGQSLSTMTIAPGTNHVYRVSDLQLSYDGKVLAGVLSRNYHESFWYGEAILWDWGSAQQLRTIPSPRKNTSIQSVALMPDRKSMALAGGDGVDVVDMTTSQSRSFYSSPDNKRTTLVAMSADGQLIASTVFSVVPGKGESHHGIVVWDAATKQVVAELADRPTRIMGLTFMAGAPVLAHCGSDGSLRLWQFKTGKEVVHRDAHKGVIRALALSPDGKLIATGGDDGAVRVWNVADLLNKSGS